MLPNDEAPDFTLKSLCDGKVEEVTLSSFKGKKVLLFFYPMTFGIVSPTEFYQLDEKMEGFKALGYEIIAITTEPLHSLKIFSQEKRCCSGLQNMNIRLASDLNGNVGRKYGIYKEDENKNFKALILLDEENKLVIFEKSDFPVGMNFEELLERIA